MTTATASESTARSHTISPTELVSVSYATISEVYRNPARSIFGNTLRVRYRSASARHADSCVFAPSTRFAGKNRSGSRKGSESRSRYRSETLAFYFRSGKGRESRFQKMKRRFERTRKDAARLTCLGSGTSMTYSSKPYMVDAGA